MNIFCQVLSDFLREELEIEVDVLVLKKKKIVHLFLMRPLFSYKFFKEIIKFIKNYWYHRQKFYARYFFCLSKAKSKSKMAF